MLRLLAFEFQIQLSPGPTMRTITAQQVFGFDHLDSGFICIPRSGGIPGIFLEISLEIELGSTHAVGL